MPQNDLFCQVPADQNRQIGALFFPPAPSHQGMNRCYRLCFLA